MVSLRVIMLHLLVDHAPEMLPAEEDHSIKAFRLDRFHPTLRVRIQIRTFGRKLDAANTGHRERVGYQYSAEAGNLIQVCWSRDLCAGCCTAFESI